MGQGAAAAVATVTAVDADGVAAAVGDLPHAGLPPLEHAFVAVHLAFHADRLGRKAGDGAQEQGFHQMEKLVLVHRAAAQLEIHLDQILERPDPGVGPQRPEARILLHPVAGLAAVDPFQILRRGLQVGAGLHITVTGTGAERDQIGGAGADAAQAIGIHLPVDAAFNEGDIESGGPLREGLPELDDVHQGEDVEHDVFAVEDSELATFAARHIEEGHLGFHDKASLSLAMSEKRNTGPS